MSFLRRGCIALAALFLLVAPPSQAAEAPLSGRERSAIVGVLGSSAAGLDDGALIGRLLEHARVETGQRVRPSAVDHRWTVEPARRDLAGELRAARAEERLSAWLAGLSPAWPQYRALRVARLRYAELAAAGGWPSIPEGTNLRVGDSGAAVQDLRARLGVEGFSAPAPDDPTVFDPGLDAALRAFQSARGLEVDGVLGPATRRALNVSAAERLAQIDANLERWRWLPARLPAERVEVDTGAAEARLYRDGAVILPMRAIVGAPKTPTPMFASQIETIVFNPPWNVPTSIAQGELLPAEARSPGYLARRGICWVDGRLQQRPGPDNALGVIKFDLPSPFGVYLHDTPAKSLFNRAGRALSHGCMRLEKPRELALALLSPQGGTAESIEAAVATGRTSSVRLQRPVPLYVLHWTAWVEADGSVVFRPDIYGWDRKLMRALSKR